MFEVGLPSSLDGAVLTMYALAFGPLSRADLVAALRAAGLTMPDGSVLNAAHVAKAISTLRDKELLESWSGAASMCMPDVRNRTLQLASSKGWLQRLGFALQHACPGELERDSREYRWDRRRFTSFAHACRDVFLALELDDMTEFERLARLCRQDEQTHSVTNVLLAVCGDPFVGQWLDRVPAAYRGEVLYASLQHATYNLALDEPVFDYARAKVSVEWATFDARILGSCLNHIIERDILAGDFASAWKLLNGHVAADVQLMRGLLSLLTGDAQAARQAYDLAYRSAGKTKRDQMRHLQSFPALLHALLLVQSEAPEDRQYVQTWLRWMTGGKADSPYYGAYCYLEALASFYEGRDQEVRLPDSHLLPQRESSLPVLAACLTQMLYCLYASDAQPLKGRQGEAVKALERHLDECDKRGAQWLVMQIARLMRRCGVEPSQYGAAADSFFGKGPAHDLSELWSVKEMWESQVVALEQLVHGAQQSPTDSEARPVRLAWKLSEPWPGQIHVAPVEQKRTKKGGWTKGREVALRRFVGPEAAHLDYLTDQDRMALAAIAATSRGYYGAIGYEIDAEQALEALAGHPHVFWDVAPRVPVRPISLRRAQRSGISSSTSSVWLVPLTLRVMDMGAPPV